MVYRTKKKPESLANWIEANVCLPQSTAEPGPMRLYPYQRGIADAMADPAIERVSVLKSARIGYTATLTAAIAHYVVRDPASVLVLMPTEADCRDFMVSDVEPLFADSPAITDALPMPRPGRSDRNTLLHRLFAGGSLKIVAGKAPRNLRRHTCRILLIDEADAIEVSAEGDPITLAERRTMSFANRKIICGSTPLDEATSHVSRLYGQSDQRIWEMPCPSCKAFAELAWPAIEWPVGEPARAAWRCPKCLDLIPERHKPRMLLRGRWRALRPEVKDHAGFKINALASLLPAAAWGKLAAEFERAKLDEATLKVFVNTVLGEPWREPADEVDEASLVNRVEPFDLEHMPAEVLAITMGIDSQDDRFEITTTGHARDGALYVLAHDVLWGSPLDDDTLAALDGHLRQRWRHPRGGTIGVDAAVVDAGDGGHYDGILAFCHPRIGRKVLAGKGVAGFARAAIQRAKLKRGRPLFLIGVDGLKTQLFARLARGQTVRFGRALPPEYFEQLASERRVIRRVGGKPVARFERKPGMKAEGLDATVYALAARAACLLSPAAFDQREADLARETPAPKPPPAVIRSQWLGR